MDLARCGSFRNDLGQFGGIHSRNGPGEATMRASAATASRAVCGERASSGACRSAVRRDRRAFVWIEQAAQLVGRLTGRPVPMFAFA
jgi:hypothetical protein